MLDRVPTPLRLTQVGLILLAIALNVWPTELAKRTLSLFENYLGRTK